MALGRAVVPPPSQLNTSCNVLSRSTMIFYVALSRRSVYCALFPVRTISRLGWVTLSSILPWVRRAKHQSMELQTVVQVSEAIRRASL